MAGAFLFGWLVGGDASPLRDFFREGEAAMVWGVVNFPAVVVAAVAAGNPHSWSEPVFYVAFAVQWFLIGYLVSWPVSKLKY